MINAMKYKEEISNVGYDFGILEKNNKIVGCGSCVDEMKCQKCKFGYDEQGRSCDITRTEWLCQEYKEPIKLTRLEFELLKHCKNKNIKYIARDDTLSYVHVFTNKPKKGESIWKPKGGNRFKLSLCTSCFRFISWWSIEPTLIQDILDNCEVVDNEI